MRVLVDECLSERVGDVLGRMRPEYEFAHVRTLGWAGATNGKLQADAHDDGFEAMITGDVNMEFQTPRPPMPVVVIPTNRSFGDVINDASIAFGLPVTVAMTTPDTAQTFWVTTSRGSEDSYLDNMGMTLAFNSQAKPGATKRIFGNAHSLTSLNVGEALCRIRSEARTRRVVSWQP